MTRRDSIVLIVADTLPALVEMVPVYKIPTVAPVVLWTALPKGNVTDQTHGLTPKCLLNSLLVLTASNGTATLLKNPCNCGGFPLRMEVINQWDPERGWRHPHGSPLSTCWRWRPPADGVYIAMIEESYMGQRQDVWSDAMSLALSDLSKYHGLPLTTRRLGRGKPHAVAKLLSLLACRLDLLMNPMLVSTALSTCTFPWGMTHTVVVVPSGLPGRLRGPMSHLTIEFTPVMWCATAGTMLTVAAWLYAFSHRAADAFKAVMQASAPLLGQSLFLGRMMRARRYLLGFWLLGGVVLTASYQGQLLSNLTVPDGGEINTVAELAVSNLTVLMQNPVEASVYPLRDWGLDRRVRYAEFDGMDLTDVLRYVADRRDTAAFIVESALEGTPAALLQGLHLFTVSVETTVSDFAVMCESPIHRTLKKFMGRAYAAGLRRGRARLPPPTVLNPPSSSKPKPLTMRHIRAAFYALVAGILSSSLVFVLECLLFRLSACRTSRATALYIAVKG